MSIPPIRKTLCRFKLSNLSAATANTGTLGTPEFVCFIHLVENTSVETFHSAQSGSIRIFDIALGADQIPFVKTLFDAVKLPD